jgi:hypothetical protein
MDQIVTTTFNFGLALKHSACGKKPKSIEIKTKMTFKKNLGLSPQATYPYGIT